jgi:hypothetical protein
MTNDVGDKLISQIWHYSTNRFGGKNMYVQSRIKVGHDFSALYEGASSLEGDFSGPEDGRPVGNK